MNKISLQDCLSAVIDNRGVTPRKRGTEWQDNGIRVLSANNVKTSGLQKEDEIRCLPGDIYNSWMKIPFEKGDLLLTSEAPAGEVFYWDSDERIILGQRLYGLKVKKNINAKYLKYYLQSSIGQKAIACQQSGSTVFGISAKTFSNITIELPNRIIQDRVSDLLYSIDSKIELNNKIISELESMAKTLYDYWFLQFDFPDENGKPYKSSGGKMVYNEELKREIPEGWEVKKLDRYISRITNGLNPRKNFILGSGDNFYVTIRSLTGTDINWNECDKCDDEALKKINLRSQLSVGDIIFSAIGTIGRTYYIMEPPNNWNISETSFTIRAKNDVPSDFLYALLRSEEIQKQADMKAMGSTLRCLVMDTLRNIRCPDVPEKIMQLFANEVHAAYKKIYFCNKENRDLASLRDFLLPMLMNGQVTFKDADEVHND